MKFLRIFFLIIGVGLLALGWASWKFGFTLPMFGFYAYLIAGVTILGANIFGKEIGVLLMKGSAICAALILIFYIVVLLFKKDHALDAVLGYLLPIYCAAGGFASGFILYILGFENGILGNFFGYLFESNVSSGSISSSGYERPTSSSSETNQTSVLPPKEAKTIANAVQRGSTVYLYDGKGNQLASISAGDGLHGFTANSVSIRRGSTIYMYNVQGNQTGNFTSWK